MLHIVLSLFLIFDTPEDDPVMQARIKRAQAMGINERDLPPVPKVLVTPPPLPPMRTSPKDMPGYRRHGKKKSSEYRLPKRR